MPSFKIRSYKKELLDRDDIPFTDIRQNMQELEFINKNLGGHNITISGLKELLPGVATPVQIVEIGCGGGDNLKAIKKYLDLHGCNSHLTGIDINPGCIDFARTNCSTEVAGFICSDYKNVCFENKPDIIFSSLFCHHFTDEELVYMLRWMCDNCKIGFFINDLHRHPVAYYSIRLLTGIFSKSYLVKNDAPLSVQRGFRMKDWRSLFNKSGLQPFECRWKWAFRWLVIFNKNGNRIHI